MGWDENLPPLHGEGQPTRSVGRVGVSGASTKRARELRKTMTPQEIRLWSRLRTMRANGFHFRRQAPLFGFYLDFVCFNRRLVIEVDGSQHGEDVHADHDAIRDAILRKAGFHTLRFWNSEINTNLDGVLETILRELECVPVRTPKFADNSRSLSAAPDTPTLAALRPVPPREGEGGRMEGGG